jgi:hypothetical protein
MTTPPLVGGSLTPSDLEGLRKVAEEAIKAAPGDWEADSVDGEDGRGKYRAYAVFIDKPYYGKPQSSIVDTHNSEIACVHEEHDEYGGHRWDEPGRTICEHIAAFDPPTVLALLSELEAVKEQLKEAGTYTEAHERLDDLARERIAAAEAALSTLKREVVDGLKLAEGWFRDYERQHRAKGTSEGNLKADTNEERAEFLALLSGRVGGSDSTDIAASREPEWLEITLQHLDGAATALRQHGDEYRAQLIESGAHAIRQGSALSPPPPQSGEGIGKQDE